MRHAATDRKEPGEPAHASRKRIETPARVANEEMVVRAGRELVVRSQPRQLHSRHFPALQQLLEHAEHRRRADPRTILPRPLAYLVRGKRQPPLHQNTENRTPLSGLITHNAILEIDIWESTIK